MPTEIGGILDIITELINNVGFPIVVTLLLMFYINKTVNPLIVVVQELKTVVEQLLEKETDKKGGL